MDIYAKPGPKVIYNGKWCKDSQQWGSHDNPYGILHTGQEYTIEKTEVHSWRTKVILKEFPDKKFNSIWFD